MSERGASDDEARELEDAVEAEWQAANRRALDLRDAGITAFVASRQSIRKRLIAERREDQEARIRDLQERKLRSEFGEAAPQTSRSERGPERDPLPVLDVTEAVRMKVTEDATYEEIEAATGLSTRKVGYIVKALNHRPVADLAWDGSLVLGPETRNTAVGLILPVR